MVSFDIFSQPQGPSIDASLFPRVSQAGYQTGQQLGTGLSQAIEGGIEGLKTGVSIADALSVTRARDVQTRQQEIELETLPQRRQEELERLQRENDLAALEAEVITSNKDLFLEAKRTELQAAASKNRTVIQDNKNQETIAQILQGGTPQDKLALINDSNLFGTLSKNKDLTERVVGSLVRDGLLTPDNAMQIIDFSKFYEAQERDRNDRQKEKDRALGSFNKNTNELLTSQGFGNVRNAFTDVPLNTLLRDGEIVEVPKSETTIAPDGSIRLLTPQEKAAGEGEAKKVLKYKNREVVVTDDFAGKFGPAKTDLRAIENPVDDGRSVLEKYEEERNNKAKTIEGTVGASAGVSSATGVGSAPSDQKPVSKSRLENTTLELQKRKQTTAPAPLLNTQGAAIYSAEPTEQAVIKVGDTEVTLPPEISSSPEIVKAVFLAPAVSNVESGGKKKALSPKGARGLMQVLPGTFNDVVKRYNLKGKNIDNPRDNVEVGSLYLAEQIKAFGSEFGQGLELALAAYNTGPGRVADALRNAEEKTWEGVKVELDKMLKPSAYKEVSEYPDKVFRAMAYANGTELTGTNLGDEKRSPSDFFSEEANDTGSDLVETDEERQAMYAPLFEDTPQTFIQDLKDRGSLTYDRLLKEDPKPAKYISDADIKSGNYEVELFPLPKLKENLKKETEPFAIQEIKQAIHIQLRRKALKRRGIKLDK